jgi:hypothetical protein
MDTTSAICCEESFCVMTNTSPIVFIVDDDISMRESLDLQLGLERLNVPAPKTCIARNSPKNSRNGLRWEVICGDTSRGMPFSSPRL